MSGSRSVKVVGAAVVAALALVGADAATYAATGDSLLLGKVNEADKPTTLRNTGSGATLRLVSSGLQRPNLSLSSSALIRRMNADLLDGMDATRFVHGAGDIQQAAAALPRTGDPQTFLQTQEPDLSVAYACPLTQAEEGVVSLSNNSSGQVNAFADDGEVDPQYRQMGFGETFPQPTTATGEHVTFQVQGLGPKIVNIEVYSAHRATDCHVQAQAVVTRAP